MRWRPILIIILLTALISFNCFAAPIFSTDFSAYTNKAQYTTCACRNIYYNLTVVNTGDFLATFSVAQQGWLAKYCLVTPSVFALQPGESKLVQVIARIPCNVKGTFPLKTIISSDLNTRKAFTQSFVVSPCSNIGFNLTYSTPEGCRCSTFEYNFIVSNLGELKELYSFNVKGVNSTFSENNVTIAGGGKHFITARVTPPCAWGSRAIGLEISTKYTQQHKVFKLPLKVNTNCSAYLYQPENVGYFWPIIGLSVVIALVIVLILAFMKKSEGKKPGLVHLEFEEKKHFPWWKLVVIIGILAGIGVGAYFAYVYVPQLFEATNISSNITATPHEPTGFTLWDYWVYLLVAFWVLLMALLVFNWAGKYRKSETVLWAKRLTVLLLVLLLIGVAAYAVYNTIEDSWKAIWGFLVLYYPYILAGIVILVVMLALIGFKNHRYDPTPEPKEFICEYCGRSFKTELGLERHKKAKHGV